MGLHRQGGTASAGGGRESGPGGAGLIPAPARLEPAEGSLRLGPHSALSASKGLEAEAGYLARLLRRATGFDWPIRALGEGGTPKNGISLSLAGSGSNLGEEGYTLCVSPEGALIEAAAPAGAFRGAQTLRQLLPPEVESEAPQSVDWRLPCVRIEDRPRYPWRGSLLDSGRYFWEPGFVRRYIDLLALHKMNRLHWHLTEDQGWRIAIDRYPRLTEVGAWRGSGGDRHGGFYTKDQIRDIVAYAAERHIVVVPEVELPGHCVAALAAYPELSCTGGPFQVSTQWGVHEDVYCAGSEQTFAFLEDVLSEVLELFPSPYIHIGGDECPKTRWRSCPRCQQRLRSEGLKDEHELQSYFIRRVEGFLRSQGRVLIGWDEILEGGLAPNAVVQSWRGIEGGIAAARKGHDVIMSPTSHCYLDYSHEQISLEHAYGFEPTPPDLSAEESRHVLGLEGNIWTEHTPTPADVERQVFPRLCALAEAAWSPSESRSWPGFERRLKTHLRRLDRLGVGYFGSEAAQS